MLNVQVKVTSRSSGDFAGDTDLGAVSRSLTCTQLAVSTGNERTVCCEACPQLLWRPPHKHLRCLLEENTHGFPHLRRTKWTPQGLEPRNPHFKQLFQAFSCPPNPSSNR